MIVSCPSCGTRYRHEATEAELSRQARCSRCEHLFPLGSAKRTYVLLPARRAVGSAPAGPGLTIGMDDPMLAEQLAATGLNPADGKPTAMTYSTVAGERAPSCSAASTSREGEQRARRRRPFLELLVALLLASLGTAAGYFGAVEQKQDPLLWAPAGAAVGLLFGWAWVRWAARRR